MMALVVTVGCTCVSAEVSFEVGALRVTLAAARVFTAVDGRSFFPCRPPSALPFQPARRRLCHGHRRLMARGQMSCGLTVDILTDMIGIAIKMGHVVVVMRVRGHELRWHEPALGYGYHGRVLHRIVRSKVT